MLQLHSDQVFVCGNNDNHQFDLGEVCPIGDFDPIPSNHVKKLTKVPLPAGEHIKQIKINCDKMLVLCKSGRLFVCGANIDEDLGVGQSEEFWASKLTEIKLPFLNQ